MCQSLKMSNKHIKHKFNFEYNKPNCFVVAVESSATPSFFDVECNVVTGYRLLAEHLASVDDIYCNVNPISRRVINVCNRCTLTFVEYFVYRFKAPKYFLKICISL